MNAKDLPSNFVLHLRSDFRIDQLHTPTEPFLAIRAGDSTIYIDNDVADRLIAAMQAVMAEKVA